MVSVQDYYRRHKAKKDNAATLIQAAFKRAQAMKEYKKQKQASILLQSFWRAKNTMINRTPEMKKICRRLDKANAEWTEELSIGYRTTKALKIIQKSNRLHEIIEACTMLDTITRLSIDVCELLVKVNVVKKLMGLIGELNRSLPVYTAIKLSLTIVYHIIFAKESLAHEIMQLPTTLETIESLMLRLSPKIVSDNTQDPIIDILIAASHVIRALCHYEEYTSAILQTKIPSYMKQKYTKLKLPESKSKAVQSTPIHKLSKVMKAVLIMLSRASKLEDSSNCNTTTNTLVDKKSRTTRKPLNSRTNAV